ncbi:DUF4435 domain-containing protein [Pedobacter frigiditerrae]|uniref:DUF4435 domain-containing protein n=1 Tax=Pedobacter frigiditerrae TaxID=2530452 RepID=A0A4R0MRK2_9SPHI|nr:AAA family ATPase [Pedobacter frigiditerrae]TCC88664.1 DUF4435 domain-containing protein [Pedobacter frigiditerrae]
MSLKEKLLHQINHTSKQVSQNLKDAETAKLGEQDLELYKKTIHYLSKLEAQLPDALSQNHFDLFHKNVIAFGSFYSLSLAGQEMSEDFAKQLKTEIIAKRDSIISHLEKSEFNLNLFSMLGFFNGNIVAVGANGSGKTSLSEKLRQYLPSSGVVISAQKLLIIPVFQGISNFEQTSAKLLQLQKVTKNFKTSYNADGNATDAVPAVGFEFMRLLNNLLAERSAIGNKYLNEIRAGGTVGEIPQTRLDQTLKIWNSLIEHRQMDCEDGINLIVRAPEGIYPVFEMSDGEKVMLYLIAQVLQAPKDGFIIVDEPEMFLHKTVLNKLWDALETARQDCIFVYLTHDLDFASSRTTASKVWIRSFTHPDHWEIESLPETGMPEPLLMELLGSRKNILFCEGKKGSNDVRIYELLFPNMTVMPVDSCGDVINYTKAFNKIPDIATKAFGIIDSDHYGAERLSALSPYKIHPLPVAEIENLFLDESFLSSMAPRIMKGAEEIAGIKAGVIEKLEKDLEMQVAHYVSAKINYYFNNSHVSKGNDISEVDTNYKEFTRQVDINKWAEERRTELKKIVADRDYAKALSVYNNKGLKSVVEKHFRITDFFDRSIGMLQFEDGAKVILMKNFPTGAFV